MLVCVCVLSFVFLPRVAFVVGWFPVGVALAWWLPSATRPLHASWSATKRSEGREEKRRAAAGQSKRDQELNTNNRPTANTCHHTSNGCSLSPHASHRTRIGSSPRVTMASAKSQTANYGAILLRNQLKGHNKSATSSTTGVTFVLTRAQLEFSSHAFCCRCCFLSVQS